MIRQPWKELEKVRHSQILHITVNVLLYHTKENNCTLALMRTKQPLRTTTILHHSLSLKSLSSYARVLSATLLVWQMVAGGSVTSAGEALLGSVQQPGSKHNTSPSASKSDIMDLTWFDMVMLWSMVDVNLQSKPKHVLGDVWNEIACQGAETTILSLEDGEEGDQTLCNSCLQVIRNNDVGTTRQINISTSTQLDGPSTM